MKTQKKRVQRASGFVNVGRCGDSDEFRKDIEVRGPFSILFPLNLFHLAVSELCHFIIH